MKILPSIAVLLWLALMNTLIGLKSPIGAPFRENFLLKIYFDS